MTTQKIIERLWLIAMILNFILLFSSIEQLLMGMTVISFTLWLGLTALMYIEREAESDLIRSNGEPNSNTILISLFNKKLVKRVNQFTKIDPTNAQQQARKAIFTHVVGQDLHKLVMCVYQTQSLPVLKQLLNQSSAQAVIQNRLDWLSDEANLQRFIDSEQPNVDPNDFPDIAFVKKDVAECQVFNQLCFDTILGAPTTDLDIIQVIEHERRS